MAAPASQREARGPSLPESTRCHTSRNIRYVFLERCRNIPTSHQALDGAGASHVPHVPAPCHPTDQNYLSTDEDCNVSQPQHPPDVPPLWEQVEMEAFDAIGSPKAQKRLPVFRQLCGEAVAELKELPDAQAAPDKAKGQSMAQVAAGPTCNKA